MSVTLTAQEIVDLAEFAGFTVNTFNASDDELETEFTVEECPSVGVGNEERTKTFHSNHIAYVSDYPEEGCLNLGKTEEREAVTEIDSDTLSSLLSLVCLKVSEDEIETWSSEQKEQAFEYASAVHLAASDNDCEIPDKPEFLPEVTTGTGLWD